MPTVFVSFKGQIKVVIIASVSLLLLGLALFIDQQKRQRENNKWVAHTYDVIRQLRQTQALVMDVEVGIGKYAASGAVEFLALYRLALPKIEPKLAHLHQLVADNPVQQRHTERLRLRIQVRLALADRQVNLIRAQTHPPKDPRFYSYLRQSQQQMDAIRQQIAEMIALEDRLLVLRNQQVNEAATNTTWLITGLTLIALSFLFLTYYQLGRALQQRKIAEQKAVHQSNLLQRVIDNTQVGIGLMQPVRDEEGTIVDFRYLLTNPTNALMTGRQVTTLTGALMTRLLPGTLPSGLFASMVNVLETGEPLRREVPYQYDGMDITVDMLIAQQTDGILFSALDITPIVRSRQQLQRLNLELQRSNESLRRFAFIASHDLQEPLRKVQTFSDMLITQYGPQLDDQGVMLLNRSQASTMRMSQLIKDLLTYSQVGGSQDRFQLVSLNTVVKKVIDLLKEPIKANKAMISCDDLPTLWGDAMQLGQVFQNLLANALRYHQPDQPPQVSITSRLVRVVDLPSGLLSPALAGESNPDDCQFWEISVADQGIGFEEKYLGKIFEMFQRLHGRTEYEGGTGIGLAICQKIVQDHRGMMTARSRLGEGATFLIYLPA